MKLLTSNLWLRLSGSASPSANGISSSCSLLPRLSICQCIVSKRNFQSSNPTNFNSNHIRNNTTKESEHTNYKETKLKVMFFGTDDFALETAQP